MTKLLLSGYRGTMGQAIAAVATKRPGIEIAAGIGRTKESGFDFPVFLLGDELTTEFDVIVDFSHPSSLSSLLAIAEVTQKPLVIATTGFTEDQLGLIYQAANRLPIFFSANMSLGISLLRELAAQAARVLGDCFEIEILERHHNQKLDAPSGTAILLADAVSDGLNYFPQYVYDRHSRRTKREPHEIGIHSVRGGTIVGEHEIIFAGQDEVITLGHSACSKEIFATGALSAAQFMTSHTTPGLYTMADLIEVVSASAE